MTGSIDEIDVNTLLEDYDPDQSSLLEYGGGSDETTIAVVQEPNDSGILDASDEWIQELGLPREMLQEFWELRSQYRKNDGVKGPHNRAYGELRIEDRYREYIHNSDEAQQAIDTIVERVESGEDITLVCFEGEGKACHRHVLVDIIEGRVEEPYTFRL